MARKKKNSVIASAVDTADAEVIQSTEDVQMTEAVQSNTTEVNANASTESIKYEDLVEMLNGYIDENKKLHEQIQSLQDDNDKYLIRISELSYENATLRINATSQLSLPQPKPQPLQLQQQPLSINDAKTKLLPIKLTCNAVHDKLKQVRLVRYQNRGNNGYENWN